MTDDELRSQINSLIEIADENAIDRFLLEHFTEFPEDMQKKALFSFYADALEEEANIANLQKEGLETIEKLEAIKTSLQKN